MKLTWREFRDETGHYWEALPFIIRSYGVGTHGEGHTLRQGVKP
jgi:hypothetical protein